MTERLIARRLNDERLSACKTEAVARVCSVNFVKFTEKHLCQSLFFDKVASNDQILLYDTVKSRALNHSFKKMLVNLSDRRLSDRHPLSGKRCSY